GFHRWREPAGVEDADHGALAVVARDDRDPEVDRVGLPVAGQARAEASVLRPASLSDVELAQDLEPRHQLAPILIHHLVEVVEVELLQNSVDPDARLDPALHRSGMTAG